MREKLKFLWYKVSFPFMQLYLNICSKIVFFQLDRKAAKYGGVKNIPKDEMPNMFLGLSDPGQEVQIYLAVDSLCKLKGMPASSTKIAAMLGTLASGGVQNVEAFTMMNELFKSKLPRRAVFNLMVDLGDINYRLIEWRYTTSTYRDLFAAWLDGKIPEMPAF